VDALSTTGIPLEFLAATPAQSSRGSIRSDRHVGDVLDICSRIIVPAPANDTTEQSPPEPGIEGKWAPWKVTSVVLLFCGAFWGAVFWLAGAAFHLFA
jgi:hypothetical protein